MRASISRWFAVAIGTGIACALLMKANPGDIFHHLKSTNGPALVVAFGLHGVVLVIRSLRLKLFSRGELSFVFSFLLFSIVQAASSLLPWRLGEFLLPPLARTSANVHLAKGAFWWLAGRFLDLWSLTLLVIAASSLDLLPQKLFFPALLLFAGQTIGWFSASLRRPWRALNRLMPSRRWVRGLWRFRYVLGAFQREKEPQLFSFLLSLAGWLVITGLTSVLAAGMGVQLTLRELALGVLGAALGSTIPLAGLGNFGPLEAGFASALALGGLPLQKALALGFALHFWSFAFQLLSGVASAFCFFWISWPLSSQRRFREEPERGKKRCR